MALAQRRGQELLTSDQVAASVNTNPVVIRRSLGDLRRAGLVDVRHGAGAGWSLARAPQEITLLDVYDAVEQEPLFGMHHTEPNLECLVAGVSGPRWVTCTARSSRLCGVRWGAPRSRTYCAGACGCARRNAEKISVAAGRGRYCPRA
jgi:hypothetical protein